MMYLEANADGDNRDPETGWMVGVLTENLLCDALEIPQDRRSQVHTRELATLMDKLGYERVEFQVKKKGVKMKKRGYVMKKHANDKLVKQKVAKLLIG